MQTQILPRFITYFANTLFVIALVQAVLLLLEFISGGKIFIPLLGSYFTLITFISIVFLIVLASSLKKLSKWTFYAGFIGIYFISQFVVSLLSYSLYQIDVYSNLFSLETEVLMANIITVIFVIIFIVIAIKLWKYKSKFV